MNFSIWNTAEYFSHATVEKVKRDLEGGADVSARDRGGDRPLHLAALWNENPQIITTLLDAGADPKAENNSGKTAWDYVQNNEELRGTEAFWRLKGGADV